MGRRAGVMLTTVLAVWACGLSRAADVRPHAELTPEVVVGVVLFPDGETPVANLPVRVWDAEKRTFIYRSRTNSDGTFAIPKLQTGSSYILVGQVTIDVKVVAPQEEMAAQHHDIVIVVPKRTLLTRHGELFGVILTPFLLRPSDIPRVMSP